VRVALRDPERDIELEGSFAQSSDYAVCRRLHRKHGATYYFATRRFRATERSRTHALYAFVRVPDEWIDNPGNLTLEQRDRLLDEWRSQLLRGLDGVLPPHPVMRAFCDVVRETGMPLEEPLAFLDAMRQDLTVSSYGTYEDLRAYMRGSAAAVGIMMCWVLGAPQTPTVVASAKALGEAMQLTNFLRDVGEDLERGRIYLPLEDLESFGITVQDLHERKVTQGFESLMRFEIARARALYAEADAGISHLPRDSRRAVLLARRLYAKILDKIEQRDFDVFNGRAHTTPLEKLTMALRVLLTRPDSLV
jgi:phytoene synthase